MCKKYTKIQGGELNEQRVATLEKNATVATAATAAVRR
ncbi:hypothetical protein SB48_HM08orf03277 [Heyndrickxia coagulans]|uniref:Uncharacterized protein n=1 Tax=Heyndrickxia coagulans TaxID=1398 RepID=A0AAN0WBW5_HEYCO|nr:hypothetical protein SB48_HM08orf03277 [Heyndrickxia coagulans]